MSIKIMSWVWDNSPYEGKALLLHLALADFANDEGECWPSQTALARKARCTQRHVRDVLSEMMEDGMVLLVSPSNGKTSHRYRLLARNSVPPRNSTTGREEVRDRETGNPSPENHQEPSKNHQKASDTVSEKVVCPYCHNRFTFGKAHNCPAMNQLIR